MKTSCRKTDFRVCLETSVLVEEVDVRRDVRVLGTEHDLAVVKAVLKRGLGQTPDREMPFQEIAGEALCVKICQVIWLKDLGIVVLLTNICE